MTPVSREKRRSIVRLLGTAALAVMASTSLTACVVAPTHHRPAPAPHHPAPPHYGPRPDPLHHPGPAYRPAPPPGPHHW